MRLLAMLALTVLILVTGCVDKVAPPPKGSGPIGAGKTLIDAALKDGSGSDTPAGADLRQGDAAFVEGGSSISCTVDCDCPQGQACSSATGACTKELQPYYCCNKPGCIAGNLCADYLGQPGTCGLTGSCVNQCNCPQGLTCSASLCLLGLIKTYCCTMQDCPSGQPCLFSDGSSGSCT